MSRVFIIQPGTWGIPIQRKPEGCLPAVAWASQVQLNMPITRFSSCLHFFSCHYTKSQNIQTYILVCLQVYNKYISVDGNIFKISYCIYSEKMLVSVLCMQIFSYSFYGSLAKERLRSRVYKRNKEAQSQGRAGAAVFVALTHSNDNRRRMAANLSPSCARALSWEMGDRSGR